MNEIVAKKPISQLVEDCMKPNWGTGSQDLENIWKIILSHILSHFQFMKLKFSGPKFYSFELDEIPQQQLKTNGRSIQNIYEAFLRYESPDEKLS